MQAYIRKNGFTDTEAIIQLANALSAKYGEAAAAAACDMYDAIAEVQGAKVPPAEPARTPTLEETRNVINSALNRAPDTVPDETGKLVKKTATRTMRKNAARDGAQMALVPSGDGCAFCKMLGSRGWESPRSSKSFEAHLHKNCRCEYIVRFGDDLEVEGYDPDALYDEFMQYGGNWKNKMNAMRREHYAEHKVDINARKRLTWARHRLLLRNNMPKGFEDKRTIGEPIAEDRLKSIIEKAESKGIRFGSSSKSNGNFELYCGDPDILEDVVDRLGKSIAEAKRSGLLKPDADIILKYDNVLGYRGDNSAVDVGAFAETNGKTITLNKFMFDDTAYLKEQYTDAVEKKLFAAGTDYNNVIDHEFGHIVDKSNKNLRKRILDILQSDAANANMTLDEYIANEISGYASMYPEENEYCEVISELFAKSRGLEQQYAKDILERGINQ